MAKGFSDCVLSPSLTLSLWTVLRLLLLLLGVSHAFEGKARDRDGDGGTGEVGLMQVSAERRVR